MFAKTVRKKNEEMTMDDRMKLRLKRIIAVISVITVIAVFVLITVFCTEKLKEFKDVRELKEYISSFGVWGVLVGFTMQFVQVFVALIPGEFVEIGLGFTFGSVFGTLICFAGVFAASSVIFLAVKKLGIRFVELFISYEKINSLGFIKKNINNPERLAKIAFILFFIPGTPKDLFIYFFGLTPMRYKDFIAVSMLARIPTVISSTIGGNLIAKEKYIAAVILFILTGIVSVCGMLWYDRYSKSKNN